MPDTPRLFWDSSAILDALFAREDSPYYEGIANYKANRPVHIRTGL